MKNLQPLYDKILVKLTKQTSQTESGLFIPTESVERSHTGKVMRVGKGKLNQCGELSPLQVKVGDMVYFGKYAGQVLAPDDEYIVLREDEVIGILK